MLVALDMETYRERPLIGEVKATSKDVVTIAWYSGSWTTSWKPAKKREGQKFIPWLEDVFDFSLTERKKLRSHSIRHLKEHYGMAQE